MLFLGLMVFWVSGFDFGVLLYVCWSWFDGILLFCGFLVVLWGWYNTDFRVLGAFVLGFGFGFKVATPGLFW